MQVSLSCPLATPFPHGSKCSCHFIKILTDISVLMNKRLEIGLTVIITSKLLSMN